MKKAKRGAVGAASIVLDMLSVKWWLPKELIAALPVLLEKLGVR